MGDQSKTLLIGVGNALRQDDGAGPAVIAALRDRLPADVAALAIDGDATDLMAAWRGVDRVFLVDAVRSDGNPVGTVLRLDALAAPLPRETLFYSSHVLGVAEAVEMARALNRLPAWLVIYAIEGAAFGYGEDLSPPVADAVEEVARRILAEFAADRP